MVPNYCLFRGPRHRVLFWFVGSNSSLSPPQKHEDGSARSPHRILGGPSCTARDTWPRGEEALRRGVQQRTRRCPSFLHARPSLHGSLLGVTHGWPPHPHLSGQGKSDSSAGPSASRQTHCQVQEVTHRLGRPFGAPSFSPFSSSLLPWRRKARLHNCHFHSSVVSLLKELLEKGMELAGGGRSIDWVWVPGRASGPLSREPGSWEGGP